MNSALNHVIAGLVWLIGFAVLLPLAGCAKPSSADRPTSTATTPANSDVVELVVDYGDGVQKRFTRLPWSDEMTVLDALQAAQKHPRGIEVEIRGSGPMAMLTKVDDLENGQGDPAGYWTYTVNGKKAERGAGAYGLKPKDVVEWRFGVYNPQSEADASQPSGD